MANYIKKCCVPDCKDIKSKRHRFPKGLPKLFDLWLKNIGNDRLNDLSKENIYKSYKICERHFEERFIVSGTRKGLIICAVLTRAETLANSDKFINLTKYINKTTKVFLMCQVKNRLKKTKARY